MYVGDTVRRLWSNVVLTWLSHVSDSVPDTTPPAAASHTSGANNNENTGNRREKEISRGALSLVRINIIYIDS